MQNPIRVNPLKSDYTRVTNPIRWKNLRHTLMKEFEYLETLHHPHIIEFGVGHGEHAAILETCGYTVIKTDVELGHHYNLDAVFDIQQPINIGDNSFDAIVAHHVLEHCPLDKLGKILAEFHRILTPKGFLFIALPMRYYWFELMIRIPRLIRSPKVFRQLILRKHTPKEDGWHLWEIDKIHTPQFFKKTLEDNHFTVIDQSTEMDIFFISQPK